MFERDGRTLSYWMLELMSDDRADCFRAGEKVWQISHGTAESFGGFEADYNKAEADGFEAEVGRILAQSDFPGDALLNSSIETLRNLKSEEEKRSWLENLPGDRHAEIMLELALEYIITAAGDRATVILPDFIEIIKRDPTSILARFCTERIAAMSAIHKSAIDPLFNGLVAMGDDEDMNPYDDETIWNAYVRGLAAYGEKDASIIERLVEAAQNGKTKSRRGAVVTLGSIGPMAAAAAIEPLQAMIDDKGMSNCVVAALREIVPEGGDTNLLLRKRLVVCRWGERAEIINSLLENGMTERDMVALLEELKVYDMPEDDDDEYDDDDATDEAYDYDEEDAENPGDIFRAKLESLDSSGLLELADAMTKLVADSQTARLDGTNTIMGLVFDSNHHDPQILPNAITAIGERMPAYPLDDTLRKIVRNLCVMMCDYQRQCKDLKSLSAIGISEVLTTGIAMSHIVEHIGPRGAAALSELADYFSTDVPDGNLSDVGASALITIGPPAESLRDQILNQILASEENQWPNRQLAYFHRFGLNEPQLDLVIKMLRTGVSHQRQKALMVIAELGPRASAAYKAVVSAMSDEEENVRAETPRALSAIAEPRDEIINHLMRLSQDSSYQVRLYAAEAFSSITNLPDSVLDRLIELARDPDPDVRGRAIAALGKQNNRIDEVIENAIELLDDREGYDYMPTDYAVDVLSSLGPRASAAVPKLIELLEIGDYLNIRFVDVLRAIGPAAAPALDRLKILKAVHFDRVEELDQAIERISG